MFQRLSIAAFAALMTTPLLAKDINQAYPDLAEFIEPEDLKLADGLDFQQGEVVIGKGLATLSVPDDFYYLNPSDSAQVLENIWGNPPGDDTLGMIFPANSSPFHSSGWGMTIWFEDIGYVDDAGAADQDYDKILSGLQEETRENSKWRLENGYGPISLIGWAEPPSYDANNGVLYWAKELQFDNSPDHTLNFNMRVLGRKGVLVQNFITGMDELERVKEDLPKVIAMTNFNDGNRYADFDSSIDTVAAVGIGGLVAGKVLAKTGLIAVALIFLKKAWFLLLLPLLWLKNLFAGKKEQE